jgi:hypothetical protein
VVRHSGDRGENREEFVREFLEEHLPARYGVRKAQILTREGEFSHSADIVNYDKLSSPVLYNKTTAVIPIKGVYGIVEVKSTLSKSEFVDAASKIASFKKLASRHLGLIQTREYVTLQRPPRPFGVVFGYRLGGNSLATLMANYEEQSARVHEVNYFTNLVCVLASRPYPLREGRLRGWGKAPTA